MRVIKDTEKIIRQMKLYDGAVGQYKPFEPWPKQKEWLDCLHLYDLLILLKKRQVAGTTLTGVDSAVLCGLLDNFLVLALSKTGDDSEEHLDKVWQCWNSLDDDIKLVMPIKTKTMEKIIWENNSRYLSLSANQGAGKTADRVIIDEAGKINIKNSKITLETVFNNVHPTLEKRKGQLIMLGTAEGYGSFQQRYDKAKRGIGGWKSFFFSCWDDPTFTKEMRAQIVLDFGEDHANQEYPRTDTEAFLMSGNCRYNREALKEIQETTIEKGTKGYFERVGKNRIRFIEDENGYVTMFRDVEKKGKYVCGGDPCQGLEKSKIDRKNTDENGVQILRTGLKLEQVCVIRNRHEPDVIGEEILMAVQYYNNAFTGIERNKERSVVLYLAKKYWNLYYETPFEDERQTRARPNMGWCTKANNKPIIIANTDKRLRERTLIIHDDETLGQMRTFIRLVDGTCEAQEGCKDDLVMGLNIAVEMSNCTEIENPNEEEENKGYKSPDGWKSKNTPEEGMSQDELLDAALSGQLKGGQNYFNR